MNDEFRVIRVMGRWRQFDARPSQFRFLRDATRCTLALSRAVDLPKQVWDPFCGNGAIARVLESIGHTVVASGIHDHGYGTSGIDYLTASPQFGAIISNPPFFLADKIIRRARDTNITFMALLLKTQFWRAAKRFSLFNYWQPRLVLPMLWRPDFAGGGSPTMDCIWCVWGGEAAVTEYGPLLRGDSQPGQPS